MIEILQLSVLVVGTALTVFLKKPVKCEVLEVAPSAAVKVSTSAYSITEAR